MEAYRIGLFTGRQLKENDIVYKKQDVEKLKAENKQFKKALSKIYNHPHAEEEITEIAGKAINKTK